MAREDEVNDFETSNNLQESLNKLYSNFEILLKKYKDFRKSNIGVEKQLRESQ